MFKRLALMASVVVLGLGSRGWCEEPVVGFSGKGWRYGKRVLAQHGLRWGESRVPFCRSARDTSTSVTISEGDVYEGLRPFNAYVLPLSSPGKMTKALALEAAAARRGLERYLQEGGSVLLLTYGFPLNVGGMDYVNLLFGGLGLKCTEEFLWDEQHSFNAPVFRGMNPARFFYTENIVAGHPVTEGVRRLVVARNWMDSGWATGMELSEDWKVVVRAEKTAGSHPIEEFTLAGGHGETVGAYAPGSAPPLVAVRPFGKGRVMVFNGGQAPHVYLNYGVPGWSMVVEEKGDPKADLPSDCTRMVVNGLKWLAEASADVPGIGTFKIVEKEKQKQDPVVYPESVEWDSSVFPEPVKANVRGILGARTALSDGAGSVEAYVQAAKAAGLSFIVFNESLEALDAEELDTLKKECKRLSTDDFYACPGVEFSDVLGNRWALWTDRITYPGETRKPNDGAEPIPLWDGKVVLQLGNFLRQDRCPPSALLTYRNLRDKGGHPHNMWWFFRVAPWVYDHGKLLEENTEEYFYALRDAKRVDPISYERIYSPAEVAASADRMVTVCRNMDALRAWMNISFTRMNRHKAAPYISGAGGRVQIGQWEIVNFQLPYQYADVRGVQRIRARFQVSSPVGIREVRVRDGRMGVVRRFRGGGEKVFEKEFELVHDRDYELVLEVTDNDGKTALSSAIYVWCYKTSVFRCADNHNALNGRQLVWHSAWNQMTPVSGGGGLLNSSWSSIESATGWDGTSPSLNTVVHFRHGVKGRMGISTEEMGNDYPRGLGTLRKVLNFKLPGRGPILLEMDVGSCAVKHDYGPYGNLGANVGDNELFARIHRSWYFQNRSNMFTAWDHRRYAEGTEDCRGSVVWHEGEITFKRDAVLSEPIPIPMVWGQVRSSMAATNVLIAEPGKRLGVSLEGKQPGEPAPLAPGSCVAMEPCNTFDVFYAPSKSSYRYQVHGGTLTIGLGEAGQKVKAGESIPYRFAVATLGNKAFPPAEEIFDSIEDIRDAFAFGGEGGVRAAPSVGKVVDREMFLTVEAEGNEAKLEIEPRDVIVAMPCRLRGVRDNGCVAVWSSDRPWFRWVSVLNGTAYFQVDVDKGAKLWAGNVFISDDDRLRLTLVADGMLEGRAPFLEVHNPTDEPIRTTVSSPPNTPTFGGFRRNVEVPAGDSIRIEDLK